MPHGRGLKLPDMDGNQAIMPKESQSLNDLCQEFIRLHMINVWIEFDSV
jgi:hypothetical protein